MLQLLQLVLSKKNKSFNSKKLRILRRSIYEFKWRKSFISELRHFPLALQYTHQPFGKEQELKSVHSPSIQQLEKANQVILGPKP